MNIDDQADLSERLVLCFQQLEVATNPCVRDVLHRTVETLTARLRDGLRPAPVGSRASSPPS
jgi:hypothetical protein